MRLLNVSRLVSLILLGAVAALSTPTDEILHRVEGHYNSARTLSVGFVESYSMLGHPREPESGTLTLRKSGKMRWDYAKPKGKLFISDGKNVFLFTAQDNRVERWKLKDTEDMRAPLAFLLGRMEMKKEFQNFSTHPGEGGIWLDAVAKNDRAPYEKVEMLVFPDSSIHALKIFGRDGSVLSYTFRGERLNEAAPESLFRFTVPTGAEVVDSVSVDGQGS